MAATVPCVGQPKLGAEGPEKDCLLPSVVVVDEDWLSQDGPKCQCQCLVAAA